MNVMVTGATTPLGTAVIERFLADPAIESILAVGRGQASTFELDERLVYRGVDLRHPREVHDLVWGIARERSIDTVIHNAQHRNALDSGPAVHAQNVDSVRGLLDACADHPSIRRFVYRSFAEVYATSPTPDLLDEAAPLDFDPNAPQWVRDRVEADLTACSRFGTSLQIAVLRCAEVFAPDSGSQLWDYLRSRVCLRPLGFDPMVNVASLGDLTLAIMLAARTLATGVFNIPGADTLPLSTAIAEAQRIQIPIPGGLMKPLYALRRRLAGFEFRYDMNSRRFHYGGILDGVRARKVLGYVPSVPVEWPRTRWHLLLETLAKDRLTA